MRQPTPLDQAYAWHTAAMAGDDRETNDDPQCGWYRRRLVKNGPWVPARIYLERDIDPESGELLGPEVMRCEVDGEQRNAEDQWSWLMSQPISEQEYDYLTATIEWSRTNAPSEPMANVYEPIDWLQVPTPQF
jgi:hypothetical protein